MGKIGVAVSRRAARARLGDRRGGEGRASSAPTTAARSGRTSTTSTSSAQRAWYYSHIYADPKNADTVYVLNIELLPKSTDGGKTLHGDPRCRTATTTTSGSTRTTRRG